MMRLCRLDLTAYGAFDAASITLRPDARVHIVIGPNEAGKSTRRAAISDLLFGFPHVSEFAFLHGTTNLRVGGCVEAAGERHDIVRRKGRKTTLYRSDGEEFDQSIAASWLAQIDRDSYDRLFSISHDELARGAQIFLEDDATTASSIFSAAMGGLDVRSILDKLTEKADAIFRPRASTRPLNEAIAAFVEATGARQKAMKTPAFWDELHADLLRIDQQLEIMRTDISRVSQAHDELQAITIVVPQMIALSSARAELQTLLDAQLPPQAVLEEVAALLTRREASNRQRRSIDERVRQIKDDIAAYAPKPESLAEFAEIEALVEDAGTARTAVNDLNANHLFEKRDAARDAIAAHLHASWPALELAEFRARLPFIEATLPQARSILRRFPALQSVAVSSAQVLQRLDDELAHAKRRLEELMQAQGALTESELSGERENTLERLDRDWRETVRENGATGEKIIADLRALGIRVSTPLDARTYRLPLQATVREHERVLLESGRRREAAATAYDAANTAYRARCDELAQRGTGSAIPPLDGLISVRAGRDTAFEEAVAAPAPAREPSIRLYRQLSQEADAYADARFKHAADAGLLAGLESELRRERAAVDEAALQVRDLDARHDEAEQRWNAIALEVSDAPRSPQEMLEFISRFEEIRRRVDRLSERESQQRMLEERRQEAAAALGNLLASDAPLEELLRSSRRRNEKLREILAERKATQRAIEQREVQRDGAARDAAKSAAALAAWDTDWASVTKSLDLVGLAPAGADAVLNEIGYVIVAVREFDDKEERVQGIHALRASFTTKVEAITARAFAHELPELRRDPFALFDRLRSQTREMQRLAQRTAQHHEELTRCEIQLAEIDAAASVDDAALCVRIADYNIVSANITLLLEQTVRCNALQATIAQLEGAIAAGSRCSVEAAFDQLHAAGGHEGARLALEQSKDELDTLRAAHNSLLETRGAQRNVLDEIRDSQAAMLAQAEAASLGAEIDRFARQYAALTLARSVLREQMESYANLHQEPVIVAASRYLETLTLGRYPRIRLATTDDGTTFFEVIEHDGSEKPVSALSEGTRDQLYLALRLATLEERLGPSGGPPLLLDDALKNCDDERSRAALRALGNFSRFAQVIYFTPRRIVAEFARQALGDAADIIELPDLHAQSPLLLHI